jgi:hypothetical protein
VGFREQIKESTADGSELVEVVLAVLRDQNASNRERMEAATWLADRGFGKPAPVRDDDVPGIGDFTIVINDHDPMGNPHHGQRKTNHPFRLHDDPYWHVDSLDVWKLRLASSASCPDKL